MIFTQKELINRFKLEVENKHIRRLMNGLPSNRRACAINIHENKYRDALHPSIIEELYASKSD